MKNRKLIVLACIFFIIPLFQSCIKIPSEGVEISVKIPADAIKLNVELPEGSLIIPEDGLVQIPERAITILPNSYTEEGSLNGYITLDNKPDKGFQIWINGVKLQFLDNGNIKAQRMMPGEHTVVIQNSAHNIHYVEKVLIKAAKASSLILNFDSNTGKVVK